MEIISPLLYADHVIHIAQHLFVFPSIFYIIWIGEPKLLWHAKV